VPSPLVSIIIPNYNRADIVVETLRSVAAQTYVNWECIIVDDGSTDDSENVIGNYVRSDVRFQFYKRPGEITAGANSCRNLGFERSKGEFVNWLDSDDIIAPNKIESQINLLSSQKADVATCKWGRFMHLTEDVSLKELGTFTNFPTGTSLITAYGTYGTFFPSHAFLVSRKLADISGLWNKNLQVNQDGEFFCRILINANKVVCALDTYVLYRLPHHTNTNQIKTKEKAKHLVLSWILIDTYLEVLGTGKFDRYIETGKAYCFQRLQKDYMDVISEYKFFFRKEIANASLLSRIKRKLF